MMRTNIREMKESLTKIDAREIYYFQWTSGEPYTVMASDGEKHGELVTIGYTNNPEIIHELGLPAFNVCPFN